MAFYKYFLLFFIAPVFAFAQDDIASLFENLKNEDNDSAIANIYYDLSRKYIYVNFDSSMYFANKLIEFTDEKSLLCQKADGLNQLGTLFKLKNNYDTVAYFYLEAEKLKKECDDTLGLSRCYNNLGTLYMETGEYDPAIDFFRKGLVLKQKLNDEKGTGVIYYNMGNVYNKKGDWKKAIDHYQQARNYFEKAKYEMGLAAVLNTTGIVYQQMGNYDGALKFFDDALKVQWKLNNLYEVANLLNNIGNSYSFKSDSCLQYRDSSGMYLCISKAIEHYKQSVPIREQIGDKSGLSVSFQNIGHSYMKLDSIVEANGYYQKALVLSREVDNKYEEINNLLAIGNILNLQHKCQQALSYLDKAYVLGNQLKVPLLLISINKSLSESYECLGNKSLALDYYKAHAAIKDSVEGAEKMKQWSELMTKYETEKKESEIKFLSQENEIQDLRISEQESENKKQRIIIYSAIAGFIIILFFSILVYTQFRAKKKANILLELQNEEIRQKSEEISAQRDEIEAQRDEIQAQRDTVLKQKDHISHLFEEITDSIHYAERIQRAILPSLELTDKILPPHFILFKPKDVVSGDFYWSTKVKSYTIVTAADCTGHGVPGAFMSMLGVSFMNEIVRKVEVQKASHVLDHLREHVIDALKQKGIEGEQKDGMDMSLCVLKDGSNTIQFAGANNPLWIIRKEKVLGGIDVENPEDCIEEIKADKMPVAIYVRMDPYTNHIIELQSGDTFYMFSDGFCDQFGGEKGKKFKYKPLKKLLVENFKLSMPEQKTLLDNTLRQWMNFPDPTTGDDHFEQVDDICIVGVRYTPSEES